MQVAGGIGAVGNAGEKAIGLRGGQRQRSLRVVCRALNPALERTWLPAHRCDGDLDPPFARNVGATGITRTTPNRLRGQIWRGGVGENFGRRTGKLRRLPLPWALQSGLLSKKAWLVARLPGAGRDPRFAREHRQGEHDSTSPRSRAVNLAHPLHASVASSRMNFPLRSSSSVCSISSRVFITNGP